MHFRAFLDPKWTLTLSIWSLLFCGVSMLKITRIQIPSDGIWGQSIRLECHYNLENDTLYSIKWYKDGNEFYQFIPRNDQKAKAFNQPRIGFTVDVPDSSTTAVSLKSVNYNGTGNYTCEVSGEAPTFKTITKFGMMRIMDPPRINGLQFRYAPGDWLVVNCTTKSFVEADLCWLLNGDPANRSLFISYPTQEDQEGFKISILGLKFQVGHRNCLRGNLKLKCTPNCDRHQWNSEEVSTICVPPTRIPAKGNYDIYRLNSDQPGRFLNQSQATTSASRKITEDVKFILIFILVSVIVV